MTINGEKIVTTVEYPFYIKGQGFIKAGKLWLGAEVINANGGVCKLKDSHLELAVKPQKVYTFQVEDFHTCHIGSLGILYIMLNAVIIIFLMMNILIGNVWDVAGEIPKK